jgi:CBS domain-containing protein
MVKSYRGVPHQDHITLTTGKHISDYMSKKLVSFNDELSIYEAMHTLLKHRISGAPVVNENQELIGVLSEGDCLKEIIKGRYDNELYLTGTVGDHMTKEVVSIEPTMTILDAANLFLRKRYRRFPVVKDGKLVGLLTISDILRAINDL